MSPSNHMAATWSGAARGNMADIDCMTCLVQYSNGLELAPNERSTKGTYVDGAGVTHATWRWTHGLFVLVCTLGHYDTNGNRIWYVTNQTVEVRGGRTQHG